MRAIACGHAREYVAFNSDARSQPVHFRSYKHSLVALCVVSFAQAEALRARKQQRLAAHRDAVAGATAAAGAAATDDAARAEMVVAQWVQRAGGGGGIVKMLRTLHELGGGCFLSQPLPLGDSPTQPEVKKAFFRAVRAVHPDKQSQARESVCGLDHQLLAKSAFTALASAYEDFKANAK